MADGLSEKQIERAYQVFLKHCETSSPADAVKELETMMVPAPLIKAVREKHEGETVRIRNLDQPPSVWRDGRTTWYTGPKDSDRNWPAVVKSLQAKNFGADNIASVDEASTKILSLLDHPKQDKFSTRGLVVGFVQSGKTTNFTAVMAKAADRGYRLFIVLSGIHNTLRRQTQIRLAGDLVHANPDLWHEVTTELKDFTPPGGNPQVFFATKGHHMLLVVKKNAAVLRKLRDWLDKGGDYLARTPTLIIDDEADQSTVATAKINPLLHQVMSKFPKVGDIGYTATPFANLLINPADTTDFYPRDFIVNLPQPIGYQGTEILFGRELLPGEDPADLPGGFDMVRTVPDDEVDDLKPRAKKDVADFYPGVTHSLRRSVEWFWLATEVFSVAGWQVVATRRGW
ncbi:Endonuclease [Pseudonocardia sp. Ae406_Ps2]|uniref:hypothetical protein n=1 Tax=unclassified Pseudonocardia TaxID=2619320 RepID=UPI00094ACCAA|nr:MULTISPECIES: hypothetical protein [unclassified Pseudonocardia]OLL96707.1 Endonuclease [Pseudonocardia sp. Ae331_Ps2]OLM05583.1 Endonuclease [Pseudonocardia sp. Ae406_Ps2]OLM27150.1 Endonuclease [Pseudonocardia sp. Ae706_Ps2]